MTVDLSIAIVSWNTRDLLRDCLKSVYDKTSGVEFEVVVVDNASSDGSVEMVRGEFPQATLVANTQNTGFAAANNQAIEVSKGRYHMLLNPDTVVLTNLALIVGFLDADNSIGVAGCKCLNPDGSIQKNWFDSYPSVFSELGPEWLRNGFDRLIRPRNADTEFPTRWVGGQCMTVRRCCIEQVGAMDAGFFMYSEETDWCYRIRKAGWGIRHYPGISVIHLGGQSTRQIRPQMLVELYRSKTQFIRKHSCAVHAALFKRCLHIRTRLLKLALAASGNGGDEDTARLLATTELLKAIKGF